MNTIWQNLRRVMSESRPLHFMLSRVLFRLNIDLPITLRFHTALNVKTYLHASSAAHKLFIGKYDPEVDIKVFKHYIDEDSIIFDVGANIGMFSVVASRLAQRGRVYAFEATAKTFRYLIENIGLNGVKNVFPVLSAITDKRGSVSFYEHAYSQEQNYIAQESGTNTREMLALRLDDFMRAVDVEQIDFLKIDVEGAEFDVLRSLGEKLANVQVIYFEYTERNSSRFGYTGKEIISFLQSYGFEIKCPDITNDGELSLLPYEDLNGGGRNLIAERQTA